MEITVREIHGKLQKHYSKINYLEGNWRTLHIHKIHDDNTHIGSIHFSLDGSPPKGYGLYIVGHRELNLYDAWEKRLRSITNCHITDLDDFKDIDTLKKE